MKENKQLDGKSFLIEESRNQKFLQLTQVVDILEKFPGHSAMKYLFV